MIEFTPENLQALIMSVINNDAIAVRPCTECQGSCAGCAHENFCK